MLQIIKKVLRRTPLAWLVKAARGRSILRQWQEQGRPVPPPPAFKQSVVREYGKRFRLRNLIETGTYQGEMAAAQQRSFSRIVSIELDAELFRKAEAQFAAASHITILQGDSSQVLRQVVQEVAGPCLFWLDAHYSGGITARGTRETPIIQELEIVFSRNNADDVILIDDARCFTGTGDYPALEELQRFVTEAQPHLKFEAADDIIRLYTIEIQ